MGQKVLFTASTYSHIVNFHLPYLQRFHEEGWMVHVACGGKAMPIPYADEVVALPLEKSMRSPRNFRAAALLREKIRGEGYDLVCTHTSLAAFFTRLALRGLKERPVAANMVHGYLFDDETSRLKRSLLLNAERWAAPVTDLLLVMNRWDYEAAVRHKLGQRVRQVPGVGVDFSRLDAVPPDSRQRLRMELGIPENAFVLIYAAEFSARKSQTVLIRAMERLPEHVMLVLAGSGAMQAECEALAGRLHLGGRVLFPGYVKDMRPWYAMADAAVSSSRIEGLPFNIMEAMYAGLPVVASDVKGHSDLVTEGETGLLYPYGDAFACAEQVRRLLDSEDLRRTLTENAKENVGQYRLEAVFPAVWEAYHGLFPVRTVDAGGVEQQGAQQASDYR